MTDPSTPHRIEYTRNKHSRALYKEGTIVIRLARNLSERQEQDHIQNLLRRMHTIVLKERDRTSIDPFRPLFQGEQQLALRTTIGTQQVITLQPSKRTKARRTAEGWTIEVGTDVRRKRLHRFLWTLIADRELHAITDLVDRINEDTLRVRIRGVRMAYASSQWGSCSSRGDIMLNAVLLFLPERLLRYVIIHELAHRLRRDHSAAYWRVVASVLPDYKERRRELLSCRICPL